MFFPLLFHLFFLANSALKSAAASMPNITTTAAQQTVNGLKISVLPVIIHVKKIDHAV